MDRRTVVASIAVATTLLAAGLPRSAPRASTAGPLHFQDRAFLFYALEQDLAQLEVGELAAEKAEDEAVRRLAREKVDRHARSRDLLAGLARARGLEPTAEPSPLHRRSRALLGKLAGRAHDQEYVGTQAVWDYVGLYGAQRERLHGFDPELREVADRQARELRAHRRAADGLARRLGPWAGPGLHVEDRSFLMYGAHVDLVQERLGGIAAGRATDGRVRDLARRLVEHHRRSGERLAGLAEANGLPPLREISSVSQRTLDGLQRLDGEALDWTYLNAAAFTSYGAHYRHERQAERGLREDLRALGAQAAREAKEQHAEVLALMGGYWSADAS